MRKGSPMKPVALSTTARVERAELVDALKVLVERLTRRETRYLANRHIEGLRAAKSAGDLYFAADNARMFLERFGKAAPARFPNPNPNPNPNPDPAAPQPVAPSRTSPTGGVWRD
jgi:hypothetical protein